MFETNDLETVPKSAGVYAYFYKDICLYVGESINIWNRLRQHFGNVAHKDLNIKYWLVPEEAGKGDRLALEEELTEKFKPSWIFDKFGYFEKKDLFYAPHAMLEDCPGAKSFQGILFTGLNNLKIIGPNLKQKVTSQKGTISISGKSNKLDDVMEYLFGVRDYLSHNPDILFRDSGIAEKLGRFCISCGKTTSRINPNIQRECEVCYLKTRLTQLQTNLSTVKEKLKTEKLRQQEFDQNQWDIDDQLINPT